MMARFKRMVVLVTLVAAMLGIAGSAIAQTKPARLPIEKAMRLFRYRYDVGGHSGYPISAWHPCFACSPSATPPYPKDGYYGKELSDEQQAALVQDLCYKFFTSFTYAYFLRSGDLEGMDSVPSTFVSDNSDFPMIWRKSASSMKFIKYHADWTSEEIDYVAAFNAVYADILRLQYLREYPDVTITSTVYGYASQWWPTLAEAQTPAALAEHTYMPLPGYPGGNQGYVYVGRTSAVSSYDQNGNPTGYGAWETLTAAELSCDLTRYRAGGTFNCYMKVRGNDAADSPTGKCEYPAPDPYPDYYGAGPSPGSYVPFHLWKMTPASVGQKMSAGIGSGAPDFPASPSSPDYTSTVYWKLLGVSGIVTLGDSDPPSSPADCGGCSTNMCTLGGSKLLPGSLFWTAGLGKTAYGINAGSIEIHEQVARPESATVAGLQWQVWPDTSVVVYSSNNTLQRIRTPQGLVKVVADPAGNDSLGKSYKYLICFYTSEHVSNQTNDVIAGQEGQWFKQVTVENPDWVRDQALSNNYSRVKITEATPSGSTQSLCTWSDAEKQWILLTGYDAVAGKYTQAQSVTKVSTTQPTTQRSNTRATYEVDAAGNRGSVRAETIETYQTFAWGEEQVSEQSDPGGANLGTTWAYYDDQANDDVNNYGHLKLRTEPGGYWERYTYDASGRLTKTVAQYNGCPSTADESVCKVTEYHYADGDILDWSGRPGQDGTDDLCTRAVVKLNGQEVSRTYTITSIGSNSGFTWNIDCSTPGALWNDASNVVTIDEHEKYTGSATDGRIKTVLKANGNLSQFYDLTVYQYATDAGLEITTVNSGTTANGSTVAFGTQSVSKKHQLGTVVFSESYPVTNGTADTNTKLSSQTVPTDANNQYGYKMDAFGRATQTNYLDGTSTQSSYGCCGIDWTIDRRGVKTSYGYDKLQRVSSVVNAFGTSLATTTTYAYDAAGRTLQTTLTGTDGTTTAVQGTSVYDVAGRLIERDDALGKKTFYKYGTESATGKSYRETRTYPHDKASGPIQVSWTDGEGRTVRTFTASTTSADWGGNAPTGSETLTELSRSVSIYDVLGRQSGSRSYFNLSGLALAQDGAKGTNYYESTSEYDFAGHQIRSTDEMGNISATVYDAYDQAASQWAGTDATGATASDPSAGGSNNMVKVSATFYDTNRDGTGDRRPFATRTSRLKSTATAQYATTDYEYDSLRRPQWTKPSAGPWSQRTYDSGGRAQDTIITQNGSTTFVLAKTTNVYDQTTTRLGLTPAYDLSASKTGEVDGNGGLTGNYLSSGYAYDGAGRRVKTTSPQGGFTKTIYDVLGRPAITAQCSSEGATQDTFNLTDDIVLAQTVNAYDAAGNVIQTTTYSRNHDATATGDLSQAAANQKRVRYAAMWYDNANRPSYAADYGTNGGADFTRPATPPEPNSSDSCIVSKTVYDAAGRQYQSYDNKALVTQREYDAMGRLAKLIENYTDGTPTASSNRTTLYGYNAGGQIVTQTADMPAGTSDEVTTYVYSSDLTDKGSVLKSNSYLRAIIYPDADDTVSGNALSNGSDSTYDRVEMTHNADGSLATRQDQRQVVLSYSYDDAGRQTEQKVTSGTAAGDQQMKYAYTDLGQLQKLTSYSAIDTTISSEVKLAYNGLGQPTTEYQQHGGAVVDGTTPKIQYAYDTTAAGNVFTKGHRLTQKIYPGGRKIDSVYDGHNGIDDAIGRVNKLAEDNNGMPGTAIVQYSFLGDGRVVLKDYATPQVRLDQSPRDATSNQYTAIDAFGRVTSQPWRDYGDSVDTLKVNHAYDRDSNRTTRQVTTATGFDESYSYDNLNRLSQIARAGDASGIKQQQKITTGSGPTVSLAGDTMAIGNPSKTSSQGSVSIYRINGGTWTQAVELIVSDPANNDYFGSSVALSGDTLVIGAKGKDGNQGAVYVFRRSGTSWVQDAKLTANDRAAGDYLGSWVALSGDTLVACGKGAVYAFRRSNGTWSQEAKLTASDGAGLGSALASYGDTVLAGATGSAPYGAAYVFTRSGTTWSQQAKLVPGGTPIRNYFGWSVALEKDRAVVGAIPSGTSGAAYVYERSGGTWTQVAVVINTDGTPANGFGQSVSLSGSTLAVGARMQGSQLQGATYLFNNNGGTWTQTAKLSASDPSMFAFFGMAVSLSGDSMVVVNQFTSAYVFSGVRGNALNQTWALDAVGNWSSNMLNGTHQAREHTKANEVSTINSSSSDVAHDLAGNITTLPRLVGNDANGHYIAVYDAWNRLVKLQSDEATPTVYATMAYDGRGRRISKAITNSNNWNCTYHYYLDGDSMIEVRNGSDQVLKQQVWGVSYIDELVQEGVNSNPAGQSTCDRLYWACHDANYNVNLLVDSTGVKVERYAYSPYGVRTAYKASDAGDAQLTLAIGSSQAVMVGSVAQPYGLCEFGHQGLQHDEESGLIYNRARMLQSTLGRFMQRDSIGYADGMSLYAYAGSSPIARVDPSGHKVNCRAVKAASVGKIDRSPFYKMNSADFSHFAGDMTVSFSGAVTGGTRAEGGVEAKGGIAFLGNGVQGYVKAAAYKQYEVGARVQFTVADYEIKQLEYVIEQRAVTVLDGDVECDCDDGDYRGLNAELDRAARAAWRLDGWDQVVAGAEKSDPAFNTGEIALVAQIGKGSLSAAHVKKSTPCKATITVRFVQIGEPFDPKAHQVDRFVVTGKGGDYTHKLNSGTFDSKIGAGAFMSTQAYGALAAVGFVALP